METAKASIESPTASINNSKIPIYSFLPAALSQSHFSLDIDIPQFTPSDHIPPQNNHCKQINPVKKQVFLKKLCFESFFLILAQFFLFFHSSYKRLSSVTFRRFDIPLYCRHKIRAGTYGRNPNMGSVRMSCSGVICRFLFSFSLP